MSGVLDGKLVAYPVTLFSLDTPEMQVSHICKQRADLTYVNRELKKAIFMRCEDPFLGWGGGR